MISDSFCPRTRRTKNTNKEVICDDYTPQKYTVLPCQGWLDLMTGRVSCFCTMSIREWKLSSGLFRLHDFLAIRGHDLCCSVKKSKERLICCCGSVWELLMSISACRNNVNVYSHSFVSGKGFYLWKQLCEIFSGVFFCGLEKTL